MKKDDYQEFLKSKQKTFIESGFEIEEKDQFIYALGAMIGGLSGLILTKIIL